MTDLVVRVGDVLPEILEEARAQGDALGRQRATRPTRTPRKVHEPKVRTGRPIRLNSALIRAVTEKIEDGSPIEHAAIASGIPASTYHSWIKRGREARVTMEAGVDLPTKERIFLEFLERTEGSRSHALTQAITAHQRLAFGGEVREIIEHLDPETDEVTSRTIRFSRPDPRALEWYLEKSHPKEFGTRRVEVTGEDGGPIPVEVEVSARDILAKRLGQVARRLGVDEAE